MKIPYLNGLIKKYILVERTENKFKIKINIKRKYLVLLAVVLFIAGIVTIRILTRPAPTRAVSVAAIRARNGMPVTVHEVETGAWEYWLPLYGTVSAPRLSQVSASQAEYIIDVQVEVGDTVTQGQVLALLDNITSLERVEASRARSRELQARYERLNTMYEAGAISRQEVETAYASLREAQANLQQLTSNLSRMRVVSPISGVVISRDAEPGQLNNPSRHLFEVADMSRIEVTLDIAPRVSPLIHPGMPAKVRTSGGWVDATVRRINPVANPTTGLYNCIISVNSPELYSFRLGSTVECLILIEDEADAIAIPYETIREVGGRTVVYVATEEGNASEREIERGRTANMQVRILDGLSSGEKIVQRGVDRAFDGARIWVQENATANINAAEEN